MKENYDDLVEHSAEKLLESAYYAEKDSSRIIYAVYEMMVKNKTMVKKIEEIIPELGGDENEVGLVRDY